MKKARKGFTLIEVICVLTIIAIIAAIAVPGISGYIDKSKKNNCRTVMQNFVNDLEYRIVSRRYYDINELNDALENCIIEAGGEKTSEDVESGVDSKIKGICPNGGGYTLSWTITPDEPNENSNIYTAEVKVSDCKCECVGTGENSVVHAGHEFTATLVSSEYIDEGKTIEDKYKEIIDRIIEDVENSNGSTGDLDGIVDEVNEKNPEYQIAGITTTLGKKAEWISVYYHDTFSTKESKYKFLTKSKGKVIVKDLTEEEFNDKSNWPPAEGTCGSAVFKEGWNKEINYFVGGINYADTNNIKIGWIQRDGDWYVQSNSEVDGINIDINLKETNDFQHIISENKVDTSKGLSVSARQPIAAVTNFANSFSVSPSYTGTADKPSFSHIEYIGESKYIKNGYVITDMSVINSGKTWAGVFCGTDSADKTNLEEILDQEGTLISEFQNGYRDSLVIAYQEYYKSYDAQSKSYSYTPVTVHEVIEKTEESTFRDTDIEYTKGDKEKFDTDKLKVFVNENVNVKLPTGKVEKLACIKRQEVYHITNSSEEGYFFVPSGQTNIVYPEGGDQSIIDKLNSSAYAADIWYQNPSTGIKHKVGTVSTLKNSITLDYKAGTDDSSFEIDKLQITGEFELKIQKDGSDDFLSDTGVVKTDVKHITSKDNENGFYISDSNNTDENEIINKLNCSVGSGNIYYYDSESKTSETIGSLSSDFTLSAEYNNAVDTVFRLDGLTVNANYTISVNDSTMTKASVEHSEKLKHFSDNGGYLISTNPDHAGKITEQNDSDTLNALKSAYKGELYIDYTDVETRYTMVSVDTQATITAPDYVFYTLPESGNTRYVYLDKYIGNSETMDVPREISGYWQMNVKPDNSNPFIEISYGNDTLYYIDDGKMSVIKQIGKPDVLPLQIDYSKKILYNNNSVKSVTLENCDADTITSYAFLNGGNIEYLNIGTKVKIIGEGAFQNCSNLRQTNQFVIPDSVISIGKNAFSNFGLPNGEMVINGCSELRELNTNSVNQSVNAVRAAVIDGKNCEAVLTKDIFGNDIKLNVNKLSIGGIVEKIDDNTFQNFQFSLINDKSYLIIGGNVETIGASAFQNSNFTDLIIGDNVNNIEAYAFYDCQSYNGNLNLNKVVKIGQYAFGNCKKATGGLVIPETVESIGQFAFDSFAGSYNFDNNNNNDNKIGELVIEGGSSNQGQTLGGLIFTNAKFNNVKIIGTKIKEISAYAFKNSPVNGSTPYNDIKGNLVISDSVTTIGKSAFEGCAGFTGELELPEGLTVINDATFNGCLGFTGDLNIPSTVTQIGSRAFMGCVGLNGSLTLSNSLEKIGMEAFKDCINFEGGLTIPSSVTKGIGNCAFQQFAKNTSKQGPLEINAGSYSDGTKLGSFIFTEAKFNGIKVGGIVQEISANAFHNAQSDELDLNYYDPDDPDNKSTTSTGGETNTPSGEETTTEGSLSKKTLIADYSGITGSLDLKSGLEIIGENAFYGCTGLDGTISMPKVTSIGAHAFENCSNLTGIAELKSVQTIGDSAFENCSKMSGDLSFTTTLTSIGSRAFYNGRSIGLVSIPDSVTSIGSSAFENSGSGSSLTIYGCSGKETVDGKEVGILGDGTNSIFRNSNYSNITIGGSVKIIKEYAFQFGGRLSGKLDIRGEVQEIRNFAFDTCENITGLSLDNGHIQKIYEGAFARCRRVEGGLYIPKTVNYMERCAFKQFAESTPPEKLGKLKVYGTSDANGNLGNPNLNSDGAPLFSSAHFNGVTIGGNVKVISHSQFNNRLFYDFGDNMKDENDNVIDSPLGGSPNYDFSGISGDLIIEDGVEKIGPSAFFSVQFDNVTIPKSVYEIHPKSFFFTGTGNGSLTVFGSSNANNTLGDGSNPIFLGSKFNGVTIGGRVEHIGDHLFHNMDTYNYYEYKEERDGQKINVKYNYTYSNITGNLTIKNTVLTIGVSAFESCAFNGRLLLGEMILQDNPEWDTDPEHRSVHLTTVGEYAFKNCNYFTGDLVIPYTIKSMGEGSFHGFASNSSTPGALILWAGSSDNGNTINREIFVGSQFHNVKIGGNVHKISDNAFININNDPSRLYNKVTGTLSLEPGVTEIGTNAFQNCVFDGELLISDQSDIADADKKPVSELPEVSIGANAFSGCSKFYTNYTSADGSQAVFTIPETVTAIGEHAFSGMCSSTRDSKIPALKILGTSNPDDKGAFGSKAPLENNKYPTIQIFDNAQFKNVTIGGKVKVLAEEAFNNNNGAYSKLTGNLTIESTVDYVWKRAFYNCSGFEGELTLGFDYNQETAKIIDGIQKIGPEAFAGCSKFSGGLRIPASVYSIDEKAFESFASETTEPGLLNIEGYSSTVNRKLETDNHSDTVPLNQINANIFNKSKFRDVSVGWMVQSIDDNFMMTYKSYNYDYTKISGSLYIGQNVAYIGTSAFSMRNAGGEGGFDGTLTFNMNNSYYKTISNDAFYGQKFTGDLILPHSLYVIKDSAFEECRGFNGKLEFEYADGGGTMKSVAKIGKYAFKNCVNFYTNSKVEQVLTIPNTVLAIGNGTDDSDAFYSFASNSDGPELKLYAGSHDNGTTLKKGIFKNAKFHNVTIGGKITTIDSEAFKSDYEMYNGLTGNLTIEENTVQTIKNGAFKNAKGFDGTLYLGSVKTIEANAFNNCINFYKEYVSPDGSQATFTIPVTVIEIKENAFESMCSGITDMNRIPKLEILGASLTTTDPNGNITDKAFGSTGPWNANTQKYDTITIFKNAKFNNVYIGGNVQTIAERAFDNSNGYYNGITGDIEINSKNIWAYSFYKMHTNHDHRGSLILGDNVQNIGDYAFADTKFFGNVSGERKLIIPYNVSLIGSSAFRNFCSGFANPPSLTVRGYASMDVEGRGNGYRRSDGKNYCDIFEYSCFNNVTFEGNANIIGTGAFNNSGGEQYNGWTGTLTFNTGVEYVYTDAFKPHKFSNIMMNRSVKRGGQDVSTKEWGDIDKKAVFDPYNNFKKF